MPYRFTDDDLELLLVTARSNNNWILPKGMPERNLSRAETAALETFEEAGAKGRIDPTKCRACQLDAGQICLIYPFEVEATLPKKKWHEAKIRNRKWLPVEEACNRVSKEYRAAIRNLVSCLVK
jgi:8-oxo-dGTP pyrophosphatase MutT (NUDIX family)